MLVAIMDIARGGAEPKGCPPVSQSNLWGWLNDKYH